MIRNCELVFNDSDRCNNMAEKSNNKMRLAIRAVGIGISLLLSLIAFLSPIAMWVFWTEIVGLNYIPILIALLMVWIMSLFALFLFIIQLKVALNNRKAQDKPKILTKTARFNKMAPFLILAVVFGAYNYYYPQWYYYFGVEPKFGPYIAINGDSGGIQISWDSRQATISQVLFGSSENNLDQEAWGGKFYWEVSKTEKTKHHCVLIQGLAPDTNYYYQIPTIGKDIFSFKTPPQTGVSTNVIFTILGDTQGNYNIQRQNIALMKDKTGGIDLWDFTIIEGDLVNRDDDIAEWAMVMDKNSYGGIAHNIPWMATSGNHETSSTYDQPPRQQFKQYFQNSFASNWENPDSNWDIGTYYSFNYSNVHVSMVDTMENKEHKLSARQLNWLETDVQNAKNGGLWTFVVFHSSMYSTSDHGPYPDLADQMEPLMKTYEIDAIFYGHDHIFEAYQAFNNESYGGTYCFMVAGGGGSLKRVDDPDKMGDRAWEGKTNEYGNLINIVAEASDDRFVGLRGSNWQLYGERAHHFMKVEINGDSAIFTVYRTFDGSVMKTYTATRH